MRSPKKDLIPEDIYKEFLKNLPLCCVDIVLINKNRFLLVKRKKMPAKNQWWLPGGRLFWREKLQAAALRKLKEELGIKKVEELKFLGIGESRFDQGYFGAPYHSVNITFTARISDFSANNIKLDRENHLEYGWFENLPPKTPAYVKNFIKLAGFKI